MTFNKIDQWIFDIKFIKQLIEVDKTRGILKTTNEELSPSTYRSASTKLRNLGHIKRPEALSAYANEIEQREKEARKKRVFEERTFCQFINIALPLLILTIFGSL